MRNIKNIVYQNYTALTNDPEFLEINKLRKGFDPEWLQERVNNRIIIQRTKDDILNMALLLEEYYPGQWDIQAMKGKTDFILNCSNDTYGAGHDYTENISITTIFFYIIINHTSFAITNSNSRTHQILDLLTRIAYNQIIPNHLNFKLASQLSDEEMINNPSVFEDGYLYTPSKSQMEETMEGLRTSLSVNEYNTGYQHSHLHTRVPSNNKMTWGSYFCMGEGEIRQIFALLSSNYTPEQFIMFLIMVGNFVRWESREGTPYFYFRDIKGAKPILKLPSLNQSVIHEYINQLKDKLKQCTQKPKLEWEVKNGLVTLLENDDFNQMIRLSNDYKEYNDKLVFWPNADGTYCDRKGLEADTLPAGVTTNTVLFRGEQVGLSIIVPEIKELTDDFIIHPEIKQIVKAKLESYANYRKIRQDIATRANQIADQQRSLQQNNVPV